MDPVEVIRKAIGEALVYYYPLAGRLREGHGGKLMVDCTEEGVLFVEADADVALDEFGTVLHPPFPCIDELLSDVEGSDSFLSAPLLQFQVTRLKCGGFVLALHINHTMCDGTGTILFLETLCEFVRGAHMPSTLPTWDRHFLNARVPTRVTHVHREYDEVVADIDNTIPFMDPMVHRSFFFGAKELAALRGFLVKTTAAGVADPYVSKATNSELLTAFLWRSRTLALRPDPNLETRVIYFVNVRSKLKNPTLPIGYYGNAVVTPVAVATTRDLLEHTLVYALQLVQEAKISVTEEYVRSVTDFMESKERPHSAIRRTFIVSDISKIGFGELDLGWGAPIYGGIAKIDISGYLVPTFYVSSKNHKGEKGMLVLMSLPSSAMERFMKEMNNVYKEYVSKDKTKSITSSL